MKRQIIHIGNDGYAGILDAWRGSTLRFWINAPDGFQRLWVSVTEANAERFFAPVEAGYRPQEELWYIVIEPQYFISGGKARFKITAMDELGKRNVLGEGELRVRAGFANDENDYKFIIGKSAVVINTDDGKHYRVTAVIDETGTLAFNLAEAENVEEWSKDGGIEVPTLASLEDNAYAYNTETGKFHCLYSRIDEEGKPMLVADEEGLEGDESFVLDPDGFYRRIEVDEEGLKIGDK